MNTFTCAVARCCIETAHGKVVWRVLAWFSIVAMLGFAPAALEAQIDIVTNRYDDARSGANLSETILTTANVNVNQFGKLYAYPVDGAVYAQPLYVTGVTIQGIPRNVLYVVTMNDKAYAFDADSASPSPLWITDFTNPPSVTAVPMKDIVSPSQNIYGNVGIESTPVIDRKTGALYLVARTKENGSYVQRLHALDITTGRARAGSPVTITGWVPGSALDSTLGASGRVITFNPKMHQQRPALALSNDVVLVAWGGHEDKPPYHGWIMGFDAITLGPVAVFAVAPDSYGGGIWQGGRAPTLDAAGNAYFATGNGLWDGVRSFGDSLLKFSVNRTGLFLVDYFTPGNEAMLALNDDDLSGSGFTLLPGTNLLLGGGKEGVLYLLDADNLGHKVKDDTQIVQKIAVNGGHVMGGPVFWNSASAGPLVYNWGEDDVLVAYRLVDGRLTMPYAQGHVRSPGHPGGSLTVSANGSTANTGIVWASIPTNESAKHILTAGTLRAFNAETLQEIWTSDQNSARDRVGTVIKFVPPVVVNGKVYMSNHDNAVAVYSLLPADFSISATPAGRVIPAGSSATFSVAVGMYAGFAGRVDLRASGAPSGTIVTFNPQSVESAGVATMTVAVPSGASGGSFNVTVTGTSAARVHSASVMVTPTSGPEEIALYASRANPVAGAWRIVDDATAAGGARIEYPNAGAAKVTTPLANPVGYFELTFTARGHVPYRLWMRGRADGDNWANDSAFVQFDDAVDASGAAIWRIGTPSATIVQVEAGTNAGLAGWGWASNLYGGLGPLVSFATSGEHTIRLQIREDGMSIDQIVLSAKLYLSTAPGATKNDTTILTPSTAIVSRRELVLYASEAAAFGAWSVVADPTAAGGALMANPNAGAAKLLSAQATPASYIDLTFTADAGVPYRLWLRGKAEQNSWANDSVFVQFSDAVDETGAAVWSIGTSLATSVSLEECIGCGVSGWGWQDNGYGSVGTLGPLVRFATTGTHTMRIQVREDGFSIDQVVLSSERYVTVAPGANRNDTTVLPR